MASPDAFVVARNPEEGSSLPYLVRLPLEGGVLLKVREPWPVTSRVYCHPLDAWPEDVEVLEEVPVRACARRGKAIDLVLDRGRNFRSQFVFTDPHPGRTRRRSMVFWQTARTARRARPGQRAPTRRAPGPAELEIVVDSRERYAYRFPGREVALRKETLACGDYAVFSGEEVRGAVERKTHEDLLKALLDGSLAFALAELSELPHAAVAAETRYAKLLAEPRVQPGWLAEVVARLTVRYPSVPLVLCDSRKLAEDFTHRFLAAALAGDGEG